MFRSGEPQTELYRAGVRGAGEAGVWLKLSRWLEALEEPTYLTKLCGVHIEREVKRQLR